jgi:DNA-binding transcriptional MerR regulator
MLKQINLNLTNIMTKSKSALDTQESKLVEGNILIMDLVSVPTNHGLDLNRWAELIREQGVLFYDSSNGGDAPSFKEENTTIKMYDVKDEEAMAELEKLLSEGNSITDNSASLEPEVAENVTEIEEIPLPLSDEEVAQYVDREEENMQELLTEYRQAVGEVQRESIAVRLREMADQYEVPVEEMAAMATVPVGNGDFMLDEENVPVGEGRQTQEITLSENWINDNFILTDDTE